MIRSAPLRVLLLVSVLLAVPVLARADSWRYAGPDGGNPLALAVDPADPDVVYASVEFGPIFKTTDGGESWRALPSPPFPTDSVPGLAIDPLHPGTLFAAVSYVGIFRSVDGGESWKAVWKDNAGLVTGGVRIDPARGIVYVEFEAGVLRSKNGGKTWQRTVTTTGRLLSFALDPVEPGVLYVGNEFGISRSNDGAGSWKRFGRTLSLRDVTSLAVEPGRRGHRRFYAATAQGLLRSDDDGVTWTTVWNKPGYRVERAILAGDVLYVATAFSGMERRASLLRSADGGDTWQSAGSGLFANSFTALAAAPSDPSTLYVAPVAQGVFRSRDGAASWTRASRGLRPTQVTRVVADPAQPGHLLAGTYGAGVLATRDAGATWTSDPRPSHLFYTFALEADRTRPGRFYAASLSRVVRSEDGGATWQGIGPASYDGALALDPDHPGTVYASSRDGVQRSQDGGTTWTVMSEPCLSATQIVVVPGSGVLAAFLYPHSTCSDNLFGYYRSRDGGATWTPIQLPGGGLLRTDPSTPGILYLIDAGLASSTNDGDTWTPIARLPVKGQTIAESFLLTPGAIYLGGYDDEGGKVWVTHDNGATWSVVGPPMPRDVVQSLVIDQGVIWVATFGGLRRLEPE
jgi:photosystem II stability/assembly factor-like uncharacterized protein